MLVASLAETRIEASKAERGPDYHCPACGRIVVLKKGRKLIHHFAHKPPTDCSWAAGETRGHYEAKLVVADALVGRGLKAEIEHVVHALPGDRRADVMAWSPKGLPIAIELQHTPIDLSEIQERARSYSGAGIAQIWIPFLRETIWKEGKPRTGGWFVECYAPRPFERWVHGLNGKRGMWMYDPVSQAFWLGKLVGHKLYVEEGYHLTQEGTEVSTGGYYRWSRRYRQLTLEGPYKADRLLIKVERRQAHVIEPYRWPAGPMAHLVPA